MRWRLIILSFVAALAVTATLAQTPNANLLRMNGGVHPAYYCDYTQGAFCGGESYSTTSLRWMFDATGNLTTAPNNLLLNNAALSTQSVTVAPQNNYMLSFYGTGSVTLSGAATGTLNGTGANNQAYLKVTAPSAGSLTLTVSGSVTKAVLAALTYETAPRQGDQVVTTSAAYYGPAFDHDQSGTPLGLRIEEARTNVVLNNRNLTTASWTLGATMTAAQTQTGLDGVANSATLLTGGLVSATNTVLQAITLASSARFQTAYVKRVTGTGEIDMTTDGGATWTAITSSINSSTFSRVSIPTQTLANPSVGFRIVTNGDAIVVDGVQNENGTFATSLIITGAGSVARAADVVQLIGAALAALKSANVTIVGEVLWPSTQFGSTYHDILGVNSLQLGLITFMAYPLCGTADNGYAQQVFAKTPYRIIGAGNQLNSFMATSNIAALGSVGAFKPATVNAAALGGAGSASQLDGTFRKLSIRTVVAANALA